MGVCMSQAASLITMYDMEANTNGKPTDSTGKNSFSNTEWNSENYVSSGVNYSNDNKYLQVGNNNASWGGTTTDFTTSNFAISMLVRPDALPNASNASNPDWTAQWIL